MVVKVDGITIMSRLVEAGELWRYYSSSVHVSSGEHRVTTVFTNNRKTRKCDRNLRVDKVSFASGSATEPGPVSNPIALGAHIPGSWDSAKIDEFSNMVGTTPAIVMWYQDWAKDGTFKPYRMDTAVSRGAVPMVTWEPWDYSAGGSVSQPRYALRTIAAGNHDAYIRQWARDARAWGKPFYLRFAHEMNGDWSPWGIGVNGNTSAEYVAAWRHIHDIFRQENATNARWVWCPASSRPFSRTIYPGDAYVDWTCLDGYNWGTTQSWARWREFSTVFGPSYDTLTSMTSKPVMIGETASAEQGGDKATWIRQGLLNDVPNRFPRVKAVIWFNANKETDWRVNSSPGSLAAYKEVAASPYYQGRLP
jgi:beta-mannanase